MCKDNNTILKFDLLPWHCYVSALICPLESAFIAFQNRTVSQTLKKKKTLNCSPPFWHRKKTTTKTWSWMISIILALPSPTETPCC